MVKNMDEDTTTLFAPGKKIDDKWIIMEIIGKGTIGEVYRAHQINLNCDVAIKIISKEMLQEIEDEPEEIDIDIKRFKREVQIMARVRHPNILNIFGYGEEVSIVEYIVMEYIPGDSLRFTMSEDGLDDEPKLYAAWIKKYFLPVLDGVQTIHNHNIFHRDLKPENIFMDGEIPKIGDFGLPSSYRMKAVSNSHEVKGTLAYMPPEQFTDFRKADQTADIYALGKLLFEGIHGKLDQNTIPFKSVGLAETDTAFLKEMDEIIQKATAEDKISRFQSVGELRTRLLNALEMNMNDEPDLLPKQSPANSFFYHYNRWVWLGIICAVLSVAGMALWHLTGEPKNLDGLKDQIKKTAFNNTGEQFLKNRAELIATLMAKDGSQMVLTGEKNVLYTKTEKDSMLFYIDKSKISNYLYVDFLNSIKGGIIVDNSIVKHDDKILVYLGTGSEPENQIVYDHDRFHLINQAKGNSPVSRVTYHGAVEYAVFFGKELLTENEWIFAYKYHLKQNLKIHSEISRETDKTEISMMHGDSEVRKKPIIDSALDDMGLILKEWVHIPEYVTNERSSSNIKSVSGIMDSQKAESNSKAVLRHQWEGFPYVGFRTKIKIH